MVIALILLGFLLSVAITSLIIPKIILISFKKKLFDTVNERKVHTGVVPRLGGVAFTPAILLSVGMVFGVTALTGDFGDVENMPAIGSSLALSLCAMMLLYLEGVSDDLIGVGYKAKFVVQILSALMIVLSGVWVNDLYGLFGVYEIPKWVGMPLSVLLIVYCINAINLIDGIDGLASGLSCVALFFMACIFMLIDEYIYALIAFVTLGTLIPFFRFNVFGKADKHNKIFMGDCGSQTIGLILGLLAVRLSMYHADAPFHLPNALVFAFALLIVPCLDVIRVMLGRIRRGKNPFLPDRTHIHHKFLDLGMSHRTAMSTILMLAAFFAIFNLLLISSLNINLLLALNIVLWCLANLWINGLIRHHQAREAKEHAA